jgi:hypothetical protein
MEVFGTSVENIYLIILFLSGMLFILFLFFGGFLEEFKNLLPFLNPVLILGFITSFSASAYLLELLTTIPSFQIMLISGLVAVTLACLMYFFIFFLPKDN